MHNIQGRCTHFHCRKSQTILFCATIKTLKQHDEEKINTIYSFVALGFGVVKAQDLPDKKETLKTVTKVNDYFMKKYADYRTPSFVKM